MLSIIDAYKIHVLSSKIIDDFELACNTRVDEVLAYWYFTFSDRGSLNMHNFLCSIIRQLCAGAQTLPDYVRQLWKKHIIPGSRPSIDQITETLKFLVLELEEAGKRVSMVIDALDECPRTAEQDEFKTANESQISTRQDVLNQITRLNQDFPHIRILVSSRDEVDIRQAIGDADSLDVADTVAGDIELFVHNSVSQMVADAP